MTRRSAQYEDSADLRADMIATCQTMNAKGLNHGSAGNLSVRVGARMLITPSGIPYDAMTPDMIVSLPLSDDLGDPFEGATPTRTAPSSEWRFHKALLQARPDMSCVLHAHPVHCVALAMNCMPLPACHYMVAAFGGDDVRVADYALFGGTELAQAVVTAMQDRLGCLMANHGATVLGETLSLGLWRLEELEALAKSYLSALSVGTPKLLTAQEMAAAHEAFTSYGPQDD